MDEQPLKGFKVSSIKYTTSSTLAHTIYMKEHSVREYSSDKPPGRTLFILNVPPFIQRQNIYNIFSAVGNIESVILQEKPSSTEKRENKDRLTKLDSIDSFKVAYVIFKKKSLLQNALDQDELRPACQENDHTHNGVVSWIKEYNSSIPNVQKVKDEIETFMKKYDKGCKEKMELDKSLGEADEEGWITVTRQSRKPGFERKESVGNKIFSKEKSRQEKKELKNFYTFQIRESKMKHIVMLRQKFEEDKKKIAKLKESRRFKPF